MTEIDRRFVRLAEGLMHVRTVGENATARPLLMMHASPASSRFLEPLINTVADARTIIAPDTLGNGDSAPPTPDSPTLEYYADSMRRLLDKLGIDKCDVYGTHTGSHIGVELALALPDRVVGLILDGVAVFDDEERQAFLTHYALPREPDEIGSQFNWAWHYIRDQMIFYPHFRKDAEHVRALGSFDTDYLHTLTLEVLKNVRHYHKTYHAVFQHDVLARLAKVRQKVAIVHRADEPLAYSVEAVQRATPNITTTTVDIAAGETHGAAVTRALHSLSMD